MANFMNHRHIGRIVEITATHVILRNEKGLVKVPLELSQGAPSIGDLVEVKNKTLKILTPNLTVTKSDQWARKILDPRRRYAIKVRGEIESGIREFFISHGFLETRTPLLVPCPGMEPHIRPFQVTSTSTDILHPTFLPTSPEFAMKRLLVGGLEKIFQMAPAFRDEPRSITHLPEFTLLEWYRAYAGYDEIMEDTENLFESLAQRLFGKPSFTFQGQEISVKTPWPRLKVRDLFLQITCIDLTQKSTVQDLALECKRLGLSVLKDETWDDLYFKIWLNFIEPALPQDQAVFVTRYPASQAALAVIDTDPDGTHWARRFELYAGGIELGNAFEELTDPVEQRRRFTKDMELREQIYGPSFPKSPLDEEFLNALEEGMPPSGGIAVGVDRLVMLFANEADISYTVWL